MWWHCLQDSLRVPHSLHQGNRETYAGEDQRTRQGYTTCPYPEVCCFWTHPRDWPLTQKDEVKFNLLIKILHGIHVWLRKLSTEDFNLINIIIEIPGAWMPTNNRKTVQQKCTHGIHALNTAVKQRNISSHFNFPCFNKSNTLLH